MNSICQVLLKIYSLICCDEPHDMEFRRRGAMTGKGNSSPKHYANSSNVYKVKSGGQWL